MMDNVCIYRNYFIRYRVKFCVSANMPHVCCLSNHIAKHIGHFHLVSYYTSYHTSAEILLCNGYISDQQKNLLQDRADCVREKKPLETKACSYTNCFP